MEEQFREVIPRHLAAVGVRSKDVRCPDIRVVDLGDLLGQRVPKELQEPHLLSNILCLCPGHTYHQQPDQTGERVQVVLPPETVPPGRHLRRPGPLSPDAARPAPP